MQETKTNEFNKIFDTSRKNLLDMGLRNNLLNFKEVKRTIPIIDEDIGELYNILIVDENSMEFLPKPKKDTNRNTCTLEDKSNRFNEEYVDSGEYVDLDKKDSHNKSIDTRNTHKTEKTHDLQSGTEDINIWQMPTNLDNIPEKYRDLYLQTNLTENELQKRLFSLMQYYKSSIQESGYNTLYLALGFLEWKQTDYEEATHKAPLILIPVEIERQSIDSPFSIKATGEEISLNLSLKHKLLDQGINLPSDMKVESKHDIYTYLNKVKEAIKSKPSWNVVRDKYLSTFNFKKFVMYNDLDLTNWSDNVGSGEIGRIFGLKEPDNFESFDTNTIDKQLNPIDVYNVVDADSSQIAVIEDAKKGHSLVVEGPPGTGKSQTIVNLIAELLANNQKILFVSEKKAALEVVEKRMEDIGLGTYCLGLYDNKTRNKQLLADISKTLTCDSVKMKSFDDYDKLQQIKILLNNYIEVIQSKYGNSDKTIYQLIGIYEEEYQNLEKQNQEIYKINLSPLKELSKKDWGDLLNKIDKIAQLYTLISPINTNPWKSTSIETLLPNDIDNIKIKTEKITNTIDILVENINNFSQKVGINTINSMTHIPEYIQTGTILLSNRNYLEDKDILEEVAIALEDYHGKYNFNINEYNINLSQIKEELSTLINNQKDIVISSDIFIQCDVIRLLDDFKQMKENIELSQIKKALNDNTIEDKFRKFKSGKDSFMKFLNKNYKNSKKELLSYYEVNVDDDVIIRDFERLFSWNDTLISIRNKILPYTSFNNLTDEEIIYQLEQLLRNNDKLTQINTQVADIFNQSPFKSPDELEYHIDLLLNRERLEKFIEENNSLLDTYFTTWNGTNTNIIEFKDEYDTLTQFLTKQDFNLLKNINPEDIPNLKDVIQTIDYSYNIINEKYQFLDNILGFKDNLSKNILFNTDFENIKTEIQKLNSSISTINDWNQFNTYAKEYSNEYTYEFIELVKEDKIKSEAIQSLFTYTMVNNILEEAYTENETLQEFNDTLYENNIEKFKKLDKQTIDLNKYRVREKLDSKKPNMNASINPSSSLGILAREINKKRNFKPIRQLLTECKTIITDIKPCFLMSPLSIAQYLDTHEYESYFDYVIFDEASQVKVEDALGALLRGKHYVIMGDTKQLPPTSFFDVETNIESDDDIDIQDVESILHLCKSSLPSRMLKCHYRSRHQSLIAVSNMEFYNNELCIFPSPAKNSDELGLKFVYNKDSVYDRGGSSQNRIEARDVINYAINHFKKYGNSKSLGIGTFSTKQRDAISEELEAELKKHPELQKYFNEEGSDGFFIKNIENIQGDERDVILISIGYGYDNNHKLSLSFGPLNRDGGERRLNVLTTRAKEKCVVFCNFKSGDMKAKIKTTSPRGVQALSKYLYYAETGEFSTNYITDGDFDSPFEESVYNFLTDEGYIVSKQVGCAGYRIDLAIVNPKDSNNYVLGIECDGASYHSSASARDRDRLRQNMLEGLGWKFHRIWSTDWYYNRINAKNTLLEAIDKALIDVENETRADKLEVTDKTQYLDDNTKIEDITQSLPEVSGDGVNTPSDTSTSKNTVTINTVEIPVEDSVDEHVEYVKCEDVKLNEDYVYYENSIVCYDFYSLDKNSVLEVIEDIISVESPICDEELYNRLKKVYNVKATKKFKATVDKIADSTKLMRSGIYHKDGFYLNPNVEICVRFREKPNIDYIYAQEVELAIKEVLSVNYSMGVDDLAKEVSLLFGFKSLSNKTKNSIFEVIQGLHFSDNSSLRIEDDVVSM